MWLVVGLGNPGRSYERNRHNVGFKALGELQRAEGLPDFRDKFSGTWTRGEVAGAPAALLQPLTFMNASGDSVQPAVAFLKVQPRQVVVLHDELDLPFGEVRLKFGGGHAGHNGLRSIVQRLGTPDFVRVRIGIGRPPPGFRGDVAAYVLGDFTAGEGAQLEQAGGVLERAVDAVHRVLREGHEAAMATVNRAQKAP